MSDHASHCGGLPAAAIGPAVPAKGYIVEEIRDDLYWVGDGIYNAMFLVHADGVIAIDAPPAIGSNYLAAISEVTDKPVTHLVYSHSHSDHIGAAHLFPADVTIVAHEETARTLARRVDRARPMPTLTFADPRHVLSAADQTLCLDHRGINHEVGNLFIYAPRQRVLMLVDVIYPGWVPFNRLGMANDVQGFMEAHDHALAYEFEVFVGGHVNRPGTRADVEAARAYVHDLRAATVGAFAKVDYAAIIAKTGFDNKWYTSNRYFETVVGATIEEMSPKWRHRLGGFDDCIAENAFKMLTAVSVEFAALPA